MKGFVMKHKRGLTTVAACLVIFAVLLWWLGYGSSTASLQKVEALTARLVAPPREGAPVADRRILWNEWRREIDRLPPSLKGQYWSARAERFRIWLRDFLQASRKEQAALLRETLQQIDDFRSHWDTAGGPNWWDQLSPLELESRRQQWLSMASPEDRALVNSFFRLLAAEAQAVGTTVISPWGDEAPT
jgi:hypothetical protein